MSDNDMSFLNEPEVEVMPGVYITQYGKNKQNATTENSHNDSSEIPYADLLEHDHEQFPVDMAMAQNERAALEAELLSLESTLHDLQTRIATNHKIAAASSDDPNGVKMTLGERTGLTGIHLLEQIDMRIDQISKHHQHLIKSQKQLEELLVTEDPDIVEAFEENKSVLMEQVERIAELKIERRKVLETLGPHYAELDQSSDDIVDMTQVKQDITNPVTETATEQEATNTKAEPEEAKQNDSDKGAFWL